MVGSSLSAMASRSTQPPSCSALRIVFAGDTYFGESFFGRTGAKRRPQADAHRTSIRDIQPLFAGADAVVVNLETPVTDLEVSPLAGHKDYLHRGQPDGTLRALRALHVTAVGLANNHSMDYGEPGLADTLAVLRDSRIAAFGAGAERRQAALPWTWRLATPAGPLDIVVVAGYEYNPRYDSSYDAYAETGDEGVNLWTPELGAAHIQDVRAACPDALIVAFPHGGDNYAWRDGKQAALHYALIDAGADLILGHGSHMAQEIERRGERWIVHGLGNAVFNTPGRYDDEAQHPWSFVAALLAEADANAVRLALRLYPVLSDNQDTGYRPRPATRRQAEDLAELLNARSRAIGTQAILQPARDAWGWHFAIDLGRRDLPLRAAAKEPAGTLAASGQASTTAPGGPRRQAPVN